MATFSSSLHQLLSWGDINCLYFLWNKLWHVQRQEWKVVSKATESTHYVAQTILQLCSSLGAWSDVSWDRLLNETAGDFISTSSPSHEHQVNHKLNLTGENPGPSKDHPLPMSAVILKAELYRNRDFCCWLVQGPCLVLECSRYSNPTSHYPQWQKRGNFVSFGTYMLFAGNSSWPRAWREPSCLTEMLRCPLPGCDSRRALPVWERPASPRDEGLDHITSAQLRPTEVVSGSQEHVGWGMRREVMSIMCAPRPAEAAGVSPVPRTYLFRFPLSREIWENCAPYTYMRKWIWVACVRFKMKCLVLH